ncbi:HTTM domain-containing protein [Algirhabdus cladophorae]|uniref:HTTM domain-containing protein n=1 Tax=Algirhabdus cladophorae TaxID=3377108 RepID=UPI003B845D15
MTLDLALRATEVLLALAFLQQSAEHIFGSKAAPLIFVPRAGLSILLLLGLYTPWVLLVLSAHSLLILRRFHGPYNGGSDRMGLLVLYCLCLSTGLLTWVGKGLGAQVAFGYLGVQVILSYFISGKVKVVNPDWRNGRALRDVFQFSAYPVSENLRQLAHRPRLLWVASWAVMVFEVLFPLSLFSTPSLIVALGVATLFHTANAVLFGLNRFVWFWIASYPSIVWLQIRLVSG